MMAVLSRCAEWYRRLGPAHQHSWEAFAPFKRRCACGREEWLFQSIMPRFDVPGLAWKDMTLPASGIETEGHDGATRRDAKHESPTAEGGDAQDSPDE